MRVGYDTWSLDVALGWNARYDPECITISPASEAAAFQLSSAVKTLGTVTDDEINLQASRDLTTWGPPSPVKFAKFGGLSVSYFADGMSCQRFWLGCGNVLLFATYITNPDHWNLYRTDVFAMLGSLEPERLGA
jgi:hypothetical protein